MKYEIDDYTSHLQLFCRGDFSHILKYLYKFTTYTYNSQIRFTSGANLPLPPPPRAAKAIFRLLLLYDRHYNN